MIELVIKSLAVILRGVLYRLGGAAGYDKIFRRGGVPAVIVGSALFLSGNTLAMMALPLIYGALTLGYGIGDEGDKGCWLWKVLRNRYLVRGVWGFLVALAMYPIMYANLPLFIFNLVFTTAFVVCAGTGLFLFIDVKEEYLIGIIVALLPIIGI